MKRLASALIIMTFALVVSSSSSKSAPIDSSTGIEITEVRNLGLSAANAKKSVIEVRWTARAQPGQALKSFDLALEVIYADGATEKARTSVNGASRNARFEVPTLHTSPGIAAAEMKNFRINITASYTETASKQGSF